MTPTCVCRMEKKDRKAMWLDTINADLLELQQLKDDLLTSQRLLGNGKYSFDYQILAVAAAIGKVNGELHGTYTDPMRCVTCFKLRCKEHVVKDTAVEIDPRNPCN